MTYEEAPEEYPDFTEDQLKAYFVENTTDRTIIEATLTVAILSFFILVIGWLLSHGSVAFLEIILLGLAVIVVSTVIIALAIKMKKPCITDEEYDEWVRGRAIGHLRKVLEKLDLEEAQQEIGDMLFVHGFVISGMKNANKYRPEDLLFKNGKDERTRYSINIYTFFYPAEDRLGVFVFDINAVNHDDYREEIKEYFYGDVVGAITEDDQDTIPINNVDYPYRSQRFSLQICNGYNISVTVSSQPLDNKQNLPTYRVPDSNVENTIARLRKLLRTKKRGTS